MIRSSLVTNIRMLERNVERIINDKPIHTHAMYCLAISCANCVASEDDTIDSCRLLNKHLYKGPPAEQLLRLLETIEFLRSLL